MWLVGLWWQAALVVGTLQDRTAQVGSLGNGRAIAQALLLRGTISPARLVFWVILPLQVHLAHDRGWGEGCHGGAQTLGWGATTVAASLGDRWRTCPLRLMLLAQVFLVLLVLEDLLDEGGLQDRLSVNCQLLGRWHPWS